MALFSHFHSPTSAFSSDVFRLFDELNQFVSPSTANAANRRAFSPDFDVHETDSAFILEGNLPGMDDKSKINIEFTDHNTLLVRGRIEKSSHRSSDPESKPTDGKNEASTPAEGKTDSNEKQVTKNTNGSVVKSNDGGARYWVSERSVGEFQRSFSFPGAVDVDAVKASLEHGVLKIVVPKKEVTKGRKIEIN